MATKLAALAGKYGFNAIAINLELGFLAKEIRGS